jgi:hypothetical protein
MLCCMSQSVHGGYTEGTQRVHRGYGDDSIEERIFVAYSSRSTEATEDYTGGTLEAGSDSKLMKSCMFEIGWSLLKGALQLLRQIQISTVYLNLYVHI